MTALNIHIHSPECVYIGQRRKRNKRKWEDATGDKQDAESALIMLAASMKGYDFGRVIFCTEYYDPNVVYEIKR